MKKVLFLLFAVLFAINCNQKKNNKVFGDWCINDIEYFNKETLIDSLKPLEIFALHQFSQELEPKKLSFTMDKVYLLSSDDTLIISKIEYMKKSKDEFNVIIDNNMEGVISFSNEIKYFEINGAKYFLDKCN